MGLKTFIINQSGLAASKHCRLDEKYASFTHVGEWTIFTSKYPQIPLHSLLDELPIVKHKKGELDEDYLLVNISDQEQRSGDLENLEEVSEIGSDKNDLSESDIFVSKLGMPRGYIFLNTHKGKNVIGSTELIPYKIKNPRLRVFLKYLLLHPKFLEAYSRLESGKTPSHRRVNPYEFLKIRVPEIPELKLNNLVLEIESSEKKIRELKTKTQLPSIIINEVFAREFGFDKNLYNSFGKGMTANTQTAQNRSLRVFDSRLEDIIRSETVRFSTRFHNPPTKSLMGYLDAINTISVNDVVKSYEKGIQPKYDSEGEIPVVKIANLKNGRIDLSSPELINKEFYSKIKDEKKLRKGDIIICATGKSSLGKIDIVEKDLVSITTVDNYIIRLRENYSNLFFTYFFRSILGYFQTERDYTGATNQIHLYWDQISNFQVPDITLKKQEEIVAEIKKRLDEQKKIKDEIHSVRKGIDQLIENTLLN